MLLIRKKRQPEKAQFRENVTQAEAIFPAVLILHDFEKNISSIERETNSTDRSPRSHGLVVRAVACDARGPGFDSSSDQMFFFSPWV